MPSRFLLLTHSFLALCASIAIGEGADIRYRVTHLQETYGNDLFFYGMSPGGTISGQSPSAYTTILGEDVRTFPYPFRDSSLLGYHGDTGVIYAERYDGEGAFYSIFTIDRDGNIADTGYVPRGTSMFLGRQNGLGQIVGDEEGGSIPGSAGFLYTPGVGAQSFDTLGGVDVTRFSAINNAGWIIGNGIGTTAEGTVGGAWLWVPGQEAVLIREGFPEPVAINDAGQIVGFSGSAGFFWENGAYQVISNVLVPDPNNPAIIRNAAGLSGASDINASGSVVGASTLRATPGYSGPLGERGWIWSKSEGLLFLDDLIDSSSGYTLGLGISIATDGTILAAGRIPGCNEVQHFLLTPIPEPGAPALLLVASAFLLLRRRRRR